MARGDEGGEGERVAEFAACKKDPTQNKSGSNYTVAKRSLGLILGCASFPALLWAQQGWGTCLHLALHPGSAASGEVGVRVGRNVG